MILVEFLLSKNIRERGEWNTLEKTETVNSFEGNQMLQFNWRTVYGTLYKFCPNFNCFYCYFIPRVFFFQCVKEASHNRIHRPARNRVGAQKMQ
jgi:hypothetical protein